MIAFADSIIKAFLVGTAGIYWHSGRHGNTLVDDIFLRSHRNSKVIELQVPSMGLPFILSASVKVRIVGLLLGWGDGFIVKTLSGYALI